MPLLFTMSLWQTAGHRLAALSGHVFVFSSIWAKHCCMYTFYYFISKAHNASSVQFGSPLLRQKQYGLSDQTALTQSTSNRTITGWSTYTATTCAAHLSVGLGDAVRCWHSLHAPPLHHTLEPMVYPATNNPGLTFLVVSSNFPWLQCIHQTWELLQRKNSENFRVGTCPLDLPPPKDQNLCDQKIPWGLFLIFLMEIKIAEIRKLPANAFLLHLLTNFHFHLNWCHSHL